MPKIEPHRLAATALVRLIENGELTAEAVVASCLDRIAEREPVVRAWSHLADDAALARAREIDRSAKKTLLNGVPFGLKDIFDTADMPTTYGSPIYVGCRPAANASAATLPQAAGRITEPPVCVPIASGTMKSATAAAEPLDDPPGEKPGLCGFVVGPG